MIYPKQSKKPELIQLSGDNKTVEATLSGPQRIYSRTDTAKIIEMASKAETPRQLLELGRFVYDATKAQDKREPEYTDS